MCKYFAPHKIHAYAFLKYALKCLFVNGCSSLSILKEIALLLCKNAKKIKLARIYIYFHNVSVLADGVLLFIHRAIS